MLDGQVEDLARTADLLRRRGSGPKTLTVFSDLSLATALVAPIVGDFQRQHPDLKIRVLASYEPIERPRIDARRLVPITDLAMTHIDAIHAYRPNSTVTKLHTDLSSPP